MRAVKRIEIIIPAVEIKTVLSRLDKLGLTGYSIMKNVTGSGDRGLSTDDLGEDLSNDYILTTCCEDQEQQVADAIRPILKKFGGICLISDAKWIAHDDSMYC
jgi:nitrogen regulatory protein PII